MASGSIFNISRYAVHDGPGIRTTVFLKGCPLRCWWCHNPEGVSQERSLMFFEYKCILCKTCAGVCPAGAFSFANNLHHLDRTSCNNCGLCSETCPTEALSHAGRMIAVTELMQEIEKDVLLYDNSGGGVTFSGGEPLLQHLFLNEALTECKNRDLRTVLDTSGYASEAVLSSVLDRVDVILYDLKLADEEEHRKYTGVSNNPIKENLRMLADRGRGRDVILRFPVIPGITDTQKNVDALVEFISTLKGINEIDLLLFHDVSEKYHRLGMEYQMPVRQAPAPSKIKYIKERFESIGLYVKT
jgi:pyruvate formate lyase activating enzyme